MSIMPSIMDKMYLDWQLKQPIDPTRQPRTGESDEDFARRRSEETADQIPILLGQTKPTQPVPSFEVGPGGVRTPIGDFMKPAAFEGFRDPLSENQINRLIPSSISGPSDKKPNALQSQLFSRMVDSNPPESIREDKMSPWSRKAGWSYK